MGGQTFPNGEGVPPFNPIIIQKVAAFNPDPIAVFRFNSFVAQISPQKPQRIRNSSSPEGGLNVMNLFDNNRIDPHVYVIPYNGGIL